MGFLSLSHPSLLLSLLLSVFVGKIPSVVALLTPK